MAMQVRDGTRDRCLVEAAPALFIDVDEVLDQLATMSHQERLAVMWAQHETMSE
jgi:hypothetical protein